MILDFLKREKKEKKAMSADNARNLFWYGDRHITLEKAIKKEISWVESEINNSCKIENRRILCKTVPVVKSQITDKVIEHFKNEGFVVKLEKFDEIPEYQVLIIGW